MSYRNWQDTLIGFVFDSWWEVAMHLAGDSFTEDTGPLDRYADALGIRVTIIGTAAVFSLPDTDLPWVEIDNGLGEPHGSDGKSRYLPLSFCDDADLKAKLNKLKEKLLATGLSPDAGPALIHVNEWC